MRLWFLPKKQKDDPTVANISRKITKETVKLEAALVVLDGEVVAMQAERVAMNKMLDEAIAVITKKGPR